MQNTVTQHNIILPSNHVCGWPLQSTKCRALRHCTSFHRLL